MLTKVVNQILVKTFYERHSGLFFFIFFLLFGMVESSQLANYHLSLMFAVVTSSVFLSLVAGIWLLYSLKVIHFSIGQVKLEQNQVIMELGKLSGWSSGHTILKATLLMDIPVLLYSSFIIGVALYHNYFWMASVILLIHLLRIIATTLVLNYYLTHPHQNFHLPIPRLQLHGRLPSFLFLVSFINERLKIAALVTKFFSITCLIAILLVEANSADIRIPLMGIIAGFAAHSVLVFEFRKFEEEYLSFQRGLPISLGKRFLIIGASYTVLLLPEAIILLVNDTSFIQRLTTVLYCIGLLLILHACLYQELNMDKHIRRTLLLFLIGFLAIISHLFWLGILLFFSYSYYQFQRNYYRFEVTS